MEKRTFRGMYDNGELRFSEPVDLDGCWNLEITLLDRADEEDFPLEANPHRPEGAALPERFEEIHRNLIGERTPGHPSY